MGTRWSVGVAGVIAAVLLAGCGGSGESAHSGRLDVVAAENFYGDIAQQLGGRHVAVSSILSDPHADPHLFEPGTVVGAEVATAGLVIENGLDYDAFVDRLLSAAPNQARKVVSIAGALHVEGADANPHLWYDTPRLPQIAKAIADGLASADPAHAAEYRSRLASFDASL